jgi:hypothetical protein
MKFGSKRTRLLVLIPVVAVLGAVGGWRYNTTEPARAADDSAVIRSGADPSIVLGTNTTAGTVRVTMPFRNDSPYKVTLTSLILPYASQLVWDGAAMTLQPGQTGYPVIDVPASCMTGVLAPGVRPAQTTPPKRTVIQEEVIDVYLKVNTINQKSHGITLGATGALETAAYNCGQPDESSL